MLKPLASRMRPRSMNEFIGQKHILAPGKPLYFAIKNKILHSMILWGPPGVGKTTLAKLLAASTYSRLLTISAVLSGVKEIREALEIAKNEKVILFIDEVHRFNKAQQDVFLPSIEDGIITFIGATTENPSFELNNALLSRTRVYILKRIAEDEILQIINQALLDQERGFGNHKIIFPEELKNTLVQSADGDARRALNLLEICIDLAQTTQDHILVISKEHINQVITNGSNTRRFDKNGDIFYDQISALHKSIRGSDPDAALYWLCRMLDGGCDPKYIARRLVRMATEDIGNADPRALSLALDALQTYERLGSPEGELVIAQTVIYLAVAAKSNACYLAFNEAMADVKKYGSLEVPLNIKHLGKNYIYPHDEPEGYAAGENYFPQDMPNKKYYNPVPRGLEIKIAEKLKYLKKLDQNS